MRAIAATLLLALAQSAWAAPDPASGCWVHAFAKEQFRPPMTTYTGPRHEPLFMEQASSLIVGPGARLLGYARGQYRKESLDVSPDTRVPDLAAIGFERRVDSFKVVCGDGDPGRPAVRGFESLDTDRNGVVSRLEATRLPWLTEDFHIADSNDNGVVDAAEFSQYTPGETAAPAASSGATAWSAAPSALFSRLDRDRDGYLSDSEMESYAPPARSGWVAMDKNGDGRISRDELTAINPP